MNDQTPTPAPSARKHRRGMGKIARVIYGVTAAGVVLLIINGHTSSPSATVIKPTADTHANSAPANGTAPHSGSKAAPADQGPTLVGKKVRIVFKVTGYAPAGASIQYGSDSDNRSPQGGFGPLGDAQQVPWSASMPYHASSLYYDVTAQLEGGGDITAKVIKATTTYWSDGKHHTGRQVLATGHASGGYQIADAQAENW
jgi:hypothetical protein